MTLRRPEPIPPLTGCGRVHFLAIGGAGMSGVAEGFQERGLTVSGCDQADSATLRELAGRGIGVAVGHDPDHLEGIDTLVVSSAIRADNPELAEARRRGIRVLHRSLALASLMADRQVIAVAGTHGKTTTSAMCVVGLQAAGRDPSFVLGGTVMGGTSAGIGTGPDFVVEADESDGTFLQYPATVAVITNIEADHLDNWVTPERYAAGFAEFASGAMVRTVVLDADDPGAARLAAELTAAGRTVITYGQSGGALARLTDIRLGPGASARLTIGDWSDTVRLAQPGVHNLYNAAAAVCAARAVGADPAAVVAGLAGFTGTARRFQVIGRAGGVTVVDDYAHHPTEVAATIAAARTQAGDGRVVVCFQPHLYSRTRDFADDFGQVLAAADEVVVLDVYPAREDPIPGVTGGLVADAARAHGARVTYVPLLTDAPAVLAGLARTGDLLLTVGAGSVTGLGPDVLDRLGAR